MSDNYPDGDETNLSAAVIPNRIRLFEEIQAQQLEQLQSLPHDMIKITITVGDIKEVKEGKRWETTPMDIAVQISKGLANSALVSSVDHVLWDMNRPLEGDCSLEIFGFDSDQGRDTFWHSSAHILGQALEQVYNCKLCVWPCTTKEEGFYYDAFYYGDLGLNDDHFPYIEEGAAKSALEGQPFERILVTKDQALEMFSDNLFKLEIINDNLAEDETTTVYRCGPLVDLCRGPHIPNTSFVKAFKCLKASSAHWKGDKDRESLQRVYGISYPDNKQLKDYLKSIEEAKIYDHRLSGQQQELFFSHPLSPGNCIYLPHGTRVYNKLMEFFKKEYWKMGYTEVITPVIYTMDFWETSRHAEYYQKNMFKLDFQTPGSTVIHNYGIKHMNCQGHCLMFRHSVRSYNELPIKLADFGPLYQNEASEDLSGLTRVRQFQQVSPAKKRFVLESCISLHQKGSFGNIDLGLLRKPDSNFGLRGTSDSPGKQNAMQKAGHSKGEPSASSGGKVKDVADLSVSHPGSSQLTIFFGGKVLVYNEFPADKAKEIMEVAKQAKPVTEINIQTPINVENKSNMVLPDLNEPTDSADTDNNHPTKEQQQQQEQNQIVERIARRASLHRFFAKRKDRAVARAPYQVNQNAGHHCYPPKPEAVAGQPLEPGQSSQRQPDNAIAQTVAQHKSDGDKDVIMDIEEGQSSKDLDLKL